MPSCVLTNAVSSLAQIYPFPSLRVAAFSHVFPPVFFSSSLSGSTTTTPSHMFHVTRSFSRGHAALRRSYLTPSVPFIPLPSCHSHLSLFMFALPALIISLLFFKLPWRRERHMQSACYRRWCAGLHICNGILINITLVVNSITVTEELMDELVNTVHTGEHMLQIKCSWWKPGSARHNSNQCKTGLPHNCV